MLQNQKKFQCFVCGLVVDTYEQFKTHIETDHEEGREYLKCPVSHCGAPLRDMRVHFRAKHPNIKLPSRCQLKASVWYDVRQPDKRKTKPTFKEGNFYSQKNKKEVHYRSSYELKIYEALELIGEIKNYYVEPFHLPYFFKGKRRTYIPDLLVEYVDGKKELWEAKPSNQRSYEQNKAKWAAAREYCINRGIGFQVYVEADIKKLQEKAKNEQTNISLDDV